MKNLFFNNAESNLIIKHIFNKNHCIILATILLFFSLQSCSNIQSPGSKKYKSKIKYSKEIESPKKSKNNINKKQSDNSISSVNEIENFIDKIENNKATNINSKKVSQDSKNPFNTFKEANENLDYSSGNRLPTIREQMQILSKDQESIRKDVSNLQDDISEIKNALHQIKNSIAFNNSNTHQAPDKGDGNRIKANNQAKVNNSFSANISEFESNLNSASNKNDYFIESDEKVNKNNFNNLNNTAKPSNISVPKKRQNPNKSNIRKNENSNKIEQNAKVQSNNFNAASNFQENNKQIKSENTSTIKSTASNVDKALNSFKRKDYQSAINELNKVLYSNNDEHTKATCNYWIGESYFRMGNYSNAIRFFENTLTANINSKKEEAKIMIGECQLHLGKTNEAKIAFQQFVSAYPKSRYIPRAKRILQQL